MPRHLTDIATPYPPEQAAAIIAEFLGRYGFAFTSERGEPVWETGGTWVIPQFVKAQAVPGRVHIEAWCARVSIIPGMYFGEQDFDGPWGVLTVRTHQKRVQDLERLLSGSVPPAAEG